MGFTVEIEGKHFKSLVKAVRNYTERLAKANGLKTKPVLLKAFEKKSNGIDALQECLATQKTILSQAA